MALLPLALAAALAALALARIVLKGHVGRALVQAVPELEAASALMAKRLVPRADSIRARRSALPSLKGLAEPQSTAVVRHEPLGSLPMLALEAPAWSTRRRASRRDLEVARPLRLGVLACASARVACFAPSVN